MDDIGFGGKKLISYLKNILNEEKDLKKQIKRLKKEKQDKINKIRNNCNKAIRPLEKKANNLMKKRLNILKEYHCSSKFIPKVILTEEQIEADIDEFHSIRKIADKYNVSFECIHNYLSRFGYRPFQRDYKDYIDNKKHLT